MPREGVIFTVKAVKLLLAAAFLLAPLGYQLTLFVNSGPAFIIGLVSFSFLCVASLKEGWHLYARVRNRERPPRVVKRAKS